LHAIIVRKAMHGQIAAARRMAVATRNTSDFACTGITLINPWEEK
jgi:hypothetical protein